MWRLSATCGHSKARNAGRIPFGSEYDPFVGNRFRVNSFSFLFIRFRNYFSPGISELAEFSTKFRNRIVLDTRCSTRWNSVKRAGFAQQMSSFLSRQRVRRFERGDEWGKKLGGGQKKGEKVLLIANRTQAVVSLTVYDVLYIYMYMHSAMWPVDSSSSSSLFFSFPSSIASFIKTNPPLLLLGRRVEAWQ